MRTLSLAAALCCGLAVNHNLQAQSNDSLFGVTLFGNELFSIDPATGAGTVIGPLGGSGLPSGVAARDGSLYTFNPGSAMVERINPATGAVLDSFAIGLNSTIGEGDIAFRSDGTGFLSTALDATTFDPLNDLYTFDITAGTSQRIGSTALNVDGLAFDGTTLYALAQGAGNLYTVNTTTAELTTVGSLGVDQNSPVAGLAFDSQGNLFGAIDDRLYSIDKITGAATEVDSTVLNFGVNLASVSGIAFLQSSNSVPDQGTTASLLLGAFGTLLYARGRLSPARALHS